MLEPSPLDVLEESITAAQANREAREQTLKTVPRWRFRRRKDLERSLERRRRWEEGLKRELRSFQRQKS